MSFTALLKNENQFIEQAIQNINESSIIKEEKTPNEILRGAGFKIKLITPTSFGTQIDFAKQYNNKDIETVLKDFTIKIKNKSVFIVD